MPAIHLDQGRRRHPHPRNPSTNFRRGTLAACTTSARAGPWTPVLSPTYGCSRFGCVRRRVSARRVAVVVRGADVQLLDAAGQLIDELVEQRLLVVDGEWGWPDRSGHRWALLAQGGEAAGQLVIAGGIDEGGGPRGPVRNGDTPSSG